MKPIHNPDVAQYKRRQVANNPKFRKNETNSQQALALNMGIISCEQS